MSINLPGPVPTDARTGTPLDWDDIKSRWDQLVNALCARGSSCGSIA
jgi:hypothetical protein